MEPKVEFENEAVKLQEVHNAVVSRLEAAKLKSLPVAVRICLDNLAMANMCLQQLAYILANQDKFVENAVAKAAATGKIVGA